MHGVWILFGLPDHDARRDGELEKFVEIGKRLHREAFPRLLANLREFYIQDEKDDIDPERQAGGHGRPAVPELEGVDECVQNSSMESQSRCRAQNHREHHALCLQEFDNWLEQGIAV